MYIAMNRFKITLGQEGAFEDIWKSRDSKLSGVPGFKTFNLIRGDSKDDFALYASHTKWKSRTDFEMWTKSEAFNQAHKGAGSRKNLYDGHPIFEGFESVA